MHKVSKSQKIINEYKSGTTLTAKEIGKKFNCNENYVYTVKSLWLKNEKTKVEQSQNTASSSRESLNKPATPLLSNEALKFVKSALTREQYEGYLKGSILYGMTTNDINVASKCITELANLK